VVGDDRLGRHHAEEPGRRVGGPRRRRRSHLLPDLGAADPIETLLFTDGYGRAIQTTKDATVHQGKAASPADVMVVSGCVAFDHMGRAFETRYPTTEPKGAAANVAFDTACDGRAPPTITAFDVLGRPLTISLPDATSRHMVEKTGEAVKAVEQTKEAAKTVEQTGEVLKAAAGGGGSTRAASKIDRGAFKAERETFWKAEAKNNPGKYSAEDLAKMKKGRAPIGPDGHPMELHHVDRTP
jgi:hypothetical protein